MAVTRLGLTGTPTSPYGSFAGKAAAIFIAAIDLANISTSTPAAVPAAAMGGTITVTAARSAAVTVTATGGPSVTVQ